jgi:hypothetical protein
MASKSQEELEQPAKVYQLMATDAKVDQALAKLDVLINQTGSLVTLSQLDSTKKELEEQFNERLSTEAKNIHLEYGPMKKNLTWFVRLAISGLVGIIIQGILLLWSYFGRGNG